MTYAIVSNRILHIYKTILGVLARYFPQTAKLLYAQLANLIKIALLWREELLWTVMLANIFGQGWYWGWQYRLPPIHRLVPRVPLHKLIDYLNQVDHEKMTRFESAFRRCYYSPARQSSGNDHPKCAALRDGALPFVKAISMYTSMPLVDIQGSRQSNKLGIPNIRTYIWDKDLDKTESYPDVDEAQFYSAIDVDAYLAMDQYVDCKPIVLYTMQPEQPAYNDDEYTITVGADNQFTCQMRGGASYTSHIWDYNRDIIKNSAQTNLFPTSFRTTVYKVVKRRVAPNWYFVALIPKASYGLLGSLLVQYSILGQPLKRYDCVSEHDGVKVASILDVTTNTYHLALADNVCTTSHSLTGRQYDAAQSYLRRDTAHNMHAISQRLNNPDLTGAADLVTLLVGNTTTTKIHSAPATIHYSEPHNNDKPLKPAMLTLMPPILHGAAYVPDMTRANMVYAVQKRVVEFQKDFKPDNQVIEWCREFIQSFTKASLVPVSIEDVIAAQSAPRQQRALKVGLNSVIDIGPNEAILKKESYGKPSPARIITTSKENHKIRWAQYQMALAQLFKTMEWYAFGKTPYEVAQRIAQLCSTAEFMQLGDFNKMDGHVNEFQRMMERELMMWLFPETYHQDIIECLMNEVKFNVKLVDKELLEIIYDALFARKSGSAETANFNTFLNACVCYCCYRYMSLSKEEALKKLGCFGGDDSASPDISNDVYSKIAKRFGHEVEFGTVQRGDMGISFLGRLYGPGVWSGELDSMCDIKRTLSKFHLSVPFSHGPDNFVSVAHARAIEKAFSYYLTDRETPIIGRLCDAILSHARDLDIKLPDAIDPKRVNWWAQFAEEVQFPNKFGEWMWGYVEMAGIDHRNRRLDDIVLALRSRIPAYALYQPLDEKELIINRPLVIGGDQFVPPNSDITTFPDPPDMPNVKNSKSKAPAKMAEITISVPPTAVEAVVTSPNSRQRRLDRRAAQRATNSASNQLPPAPPVVSGAPARSHGPLPPPPAAAKSKATANVPKGRAAKANAPGKARSASAKGAGKAQAGRTKTIASNTTPHDKISRDYISALGRYHALLNRDADFGIVEATQWANNPDTFGPAGEIFQAQLKGIAQAPDVQLQWFTKYMNQRVKSAREQGVEARRLPRRT